MPHHKVDVILTSVVRLAYSDLNATTAPLGRYLTLEDVSGGLDVVVGYAKLWAA